MSFNFDNCFSSNTIHHQVQNIAINKMIGLFEWIHENPNEMDNNEDKYLN